LKMKELLKKTGEKVKVTVHQGFAADVLTWQEAKKSYETRGGRVNLSVTCTPDVLQRQGEAKKGTMSGACGAGGATTSQ